MGSAAVESPLTSDLNVFNSSNAVKKVLVPPTGFASLPTPQAQWTVPQASPLTVLQAPDIMPAGAHFGAPPQSYQQPPQVGPLPHPGPKAGALIIQQISMCPATDVAPVKLRSAHESCCHPL